MQFFTAFIVVSDKKTNENNKHLICSQHHYKITNENTLTTLSKKLKNCTSKIVSCERGLTEISPVVHAVSYTLVVVWRA